MTATTLRLRPTVRSVMVDDEVVALDLDAGVYLGVNATGARLWPLLQAGTTLEALAALLVDSFGIEAGRAGDDVETWLTWLDEHALLEPPAG